MLTITEDIVLLGMDDEKGVIVVNASPDFKVCVAAGLLFDLYNNNHIELNNGIITKVSEPSEKIQSKYYKILPDSKDIHTGLKKLTDSNKITDEIVDILIEKNILSKEVKKVLFIKKEFYPTDNPDPENKTRFELHETVINNKDLTKRVLYLLFLIKAGNLVEEVFRTKAEEARTNLDTLLNKSTDVLSKEELTFYNSISSSMKKMMLMPV